ncbi:hypothetical protein ANN_19558, partial [Periplaneta americana]
REMVRQKEVYRRELEARRERRHLEKEKERTLREIAKKRERSRSRERKKRRVEEEEDKAKGVTERSAEGQEKGDPANNVVTVSDSEEEQLQTEEEGKQQVSDSAAEPGGRENHSPGDEEEEASSEAEEEEEEEDSDSSTDSEDDEAEGVKPQNIFYSNPQLIPDLPRKSSVAAFRLAIGHDCLAKHLHRIGIYQSPNCPLCNSNQEMDSEHLKICASVAGHDNIFKKYWSARGQMTLLSNAWH